MSKFKCTENSRDFVEVFRDVEGRTALAVSDNHTSSVAFLDPADAPALALAILEAAGYGEEVVTDGSPDGHIQVAKYYLYEGVKAHASITAEAEAQAKLEAEALELFKTLMGVKGYENFTWSEVASKDEWLAVARKAREINKEENNA